MKTVERLISEKLLSISAIILQTDNPFTWASGWNSPIYIDNRKTLSYPTIRNFIKVELCRTILENFKDVDLVAGVATGAIAQGALVADELGLPYVYVRSTPKDHGLENLIEGTIKPGQRVVLVEDLVSTGLSSIKAVEAIRSAGGVVLGMVALFTFDFPMCDVNMRKAKVKLLSLTNYNAMIDAALATNYIQESDVETLRQWREDPESWSTSRHMKDF